MLNVKAGGSLWWKKSAAVTLCLQKRVI